LLIDKLDSQLSHTQNSAVLEQTIQTCFGITLE